MLSELGMWIKNLSIYAERWLLRVFILVLSVHDDFWLVHSCIDKSIGESTLV
jgi:hypothetical protein